MQKNKQGKFAEYETKLGNPTTEQIEFAKNIRNELRYLKTQQYKQLLEYKDLDVDKVYSFFKEKYKLVKMNKNEEHLALTTIVIRFDKSIGVVISCGDTKLLRFYEKDRLFTLAEMLEQYNYSDYNVCTSRSVGSSGLGFKNFGNYD
jgi:hypothetical protein